MMSTAGDCKYIHFEDTSRQIPKCGPVRDDGDLERFIAFYTDAFGLEVVFRGTVPGMKHAVLRTTRRHLVAAGASDGAVDDLGAYHALWFSDPDGMRGELVLVVDPALRGIHAPRPRS